MTNWSAGWTKNWALRRGTLIVDESSIPKCGDQSVGVARQYCGATGKVDNCRREFIWPMPVPRGNAAGRAFVFAGRMGHGREPPRRKQLSSRQAPELGLELVRSVGPKVRHGWVTFDEAYGKAPAFLSGLEEMNERYIGDVPKTYRGWLRRPKVQAASRASWPATPQTARHTGRTQAANGRRNSGLVAGQRLETAASPGGDTSGALPRVRFVVERDDCQDRSCGR